MKKIAHLPGWSNFANIAVGYNETFSRHITVNKTETAVKKVLTRIY